MQNEAEKIMFEKLKEMSEIPFDECESAESYASLCIAMNEIYKTITT